MSTQAVLNHHLESFGAGDVDELLKDYTEDSVFISPDGRMTGLDALRMAFEGFFSGLFKPGSCVHHGCDGYRGRGGVHRVALVERRCRCYPGYRHLHCSGWQDRGADVRGEDRGTLVLARIQPSRGRKFIPQ